MGVLAGSAARAANRSALAAARRAGRRAERCRGAGTLAAKLAYFDELERIAAQFHAAAAAPEPGRLLPLLQRLDECLTCGARGLL